MQYNFFFTKNKSTQVDFIQFVIMEVSQQYTGTEIRHIGQTKKTIPKCANIASNWHNTIESNPGFFM